MAIAFDELAVEVDVALDVKIQGVLLHRDSAALLAHAHTEGLVLEDLNHLVAQVARILGLLPQSPVAPEGIAVADLVGRGRHTHQKMLARWSTHDYEVVADALDATGITELADRSVDELSGGQRQRVWIAMALAQETDILLLDEPTTFLDLSHQIEVLELIRYLNQEHGLTVVMVLHDLNQAARYAGRIVVLRDGQVYAEGAPQAVVTAATLRDVFGVEGRIMPGPDGVEMIIVPVGRV